MNIINHICRKTICDCEYCKLYNLCYFKYDNYTSINSFNYINKL